MKKTTRVLAFTLLLLMLFGICALPSFALEILPAKVIEIPLGEMIPFSKVWEDSGHAPEWTGADVWEGSYSSSEIFLRDHNTRILAGIKIGQDTTNVVLNNSVQIPVTIVVTDNPNYRVHDKEFTFIMGEIYPLSDLLRDIGYKDTDLVAYIRCSESVKNSSGLPLHNEAHLKFEASKSDKPYTAFFIVKMKDGQSIRLNINVQEEEKTVRYWLNRFITIAIEGPIALFVLFIIPVVLIGLLYPLLGLFLGF